MQLGQGTSAVLLIFFAVLRLFRRARVVFFLGTAIRILFKRFYGFIVAQICQNVKVGYES